MITKDNSSKIADRSTSRKERIKKYNDLKKKKRNSSFHRNGKKFKIAKVEQNYREL